MLPKKITIAASMVLMLGMACYAAAGDQACTENVVVQQSLAPEIQYQAYAVEQRVAPIQGPAREVENDRKFLARWRVRRDTLKQTRDYRRGEINAVLLRDTDTVQTQQMRAVQCQTVAVKPVRQYQRVPTTSYEQRTVRVPVTTYEERTVEVPVTTYQLKEVQTCDPVVQPRVLQQSLVPEPATAIGIGS